MTTAILVAGMHRSGTSATAGALRMCGVDLEAELLAAGSDNRLGYWENAGAIAIHERLLAELGRGWDDVRALPIGWLSSDAARAADAGINELIESEFASATLWAVNDPRICRFLPLWKRVLSLRGIRMVTLIVARRPSEVAASIQTRNEWMPALSELLWMRHVFDAERDSRDVERCVITYDEMLASPREVMGRALGRLGVNLLHASPLPEDTLGRFVSESERHHRHSSESGGAWQSIAERAFELLARIARENVGWNALAALGGTFEESDLATSPYIKAVADWASKFREREARANAQIRQVTSDLNAQMAWSVQAVEREQKLHEDIARANAGLNAQIAWSTHAVKREQELHKEIAQTTAALNAQILWSEKAVKREWALRSELIAERNDHATKVAELVDRIEALLASKRALEAKLASVMNSLSWRVSKPVRVIANLLRSVS